MFYVNISPTMTKTDLLLKAIAEPEQFAPEQLDALLADPEMRELYRLLSHAADASAKSSPSDIDAEWKRFATANAASLRRSRFARLHGLLTRRIAIAAAVAAISIAAVGAGIAISRRALPQSAEQPAAEAASPAATSPSATAEALPDTIAAGSKEAPILIFENETLESILTQIAAERGATVEFRSETPRSLRLYFAWPRTLPLAPTVDLLNGFDQIDITLRNDTITVH